MGYECKSICEIKEKLESWVKETMDQGPQHIDAGELGEVIDMIKDMAEAKKYMAEACYYKSVTDAMEEYAGPSGYSPEPWKRMYIHKPYMDQDQMPYDDMDNYRMGYPMNKIEGDWRYELPTRYGKSYGDFKMARKHYTETNSPNDKEEMDAHAMEHMSNMMTTVRDIWKAADPELRKNIKNNLTMLTGELTD